MTGDYYPLHTDIEYAKRTYFKQRIAHGMLIISYSTGLIKMEPDVIVANYGIEKLRFIKPVFINDTIYVKLEILELTDKGNGTGVVTIKQTTEKQTGEECIIGISKILVNKKN